MGGDIRVESQPGAGSAFSFQVPLPEAEGPMEVERTGRVLRLEEGQRAFKLLVVDDRPENRDLLAQLLASVGFEVATAADGIEALAAWEREAPDMVWLDIRMPRLDGFGALAEIRRREAESGRGRTVVVAITASVIDQDRDSMLAKGFDDYLGKPFREQVLFDLCVQHLGVRFLTGRAEGAAAADPPLVPRDLAGLDPAWRALLRSFISEGDVDGALALLDELEGPGDLAGRLRQRLKTYRLEELLQALEP